ncbi:hypothetical protein D3C86_1455880 [compost metagenome]
MVNPKDVNDVKLLSNTAKIRVSLYTTKGFIERNNQISYVRFFFNDAVVYMYFSNFIGIYEGPFYIKRENEAEFGMFCIKSLSNYVNGELVVELKPKNPLNPFYRLVLKNISKTDYDLLMENINKIL